MTQNDNNEVITQVNQSIDPQVNTKYNWKPQV